MADVRAAGNKRVGSLLSLVRGEGMLGSTVMTMAFSAAILLVNVATGMITARLLGPEGRGAQAAMILWPQFLAFATTFGLQMSLLFHVKKSPEEEGELYYSTVFLSFFTGAAAVTIGYFFIPFWLGSHTSGSPPGDIIAAGQWFMLAVPFIHLFFIHNALFRAREEFSLFNRMRYLVPICTLALLIAFSAMGILTPFSSALAYLLPYVPASGWAVYRSIRHYRLAMGMVRSAIGRIFQYAYRSYGIDLLGTMILYMDQIILVGLLAPGPLGLYVVAVSLSRMVNVFSNSIIMVLFPKASELKDEEAARLSLKVFKISTALSLSGSAVIMLLAPIVIRLLYGEAFLESITVFRLLLLDVVIAGAVFVLGQSFMAVGKPGVVALSQGLGLALIVPLLYELTPRYGIVGAGISLLGASLFRLAFMMISFERKFRFGYGAQWISGEDVRWFKEQLNNRKHRGKGSVET